MIPLARFSDIRRYLRIRCQKRFRRHRWDRAPDEVGRIACDNGLGAASGSTGELERSSTLTMSADASD